MNTRTVNDTNGRTWTCTADAVTGDDAARPQGRDVMLSCTTPSVAEPVRITVGWQWERMAPAGLARAIALVSPAPRS